MKIGNPLGRDKRDRRRSDLGGFVLGSWQPWHVVLLVFKYCSSGLCVITKEHRNMQ